MKDYKEMLKEAMEKIPASVKSDGRLEVPKPFVNVTGNQTTISNFKEITDVLRREPQHLAKYLFREFAVPGHLDGNRLIFQGKIYSNLVEKKLESYQKEYVFCLECGKPDTHVVKQGRISFLKCEACGAKHPLKNISKR